MEDIISTINNSFKIHLSDLKNNGSGILYGKLHLYVNNNCMNPDIDLDPINIIPVADLIDLFDCVDEYIPIVENFLFKQNIQYIKNNLLYPLCQSMYDRMDEKFDFDLDEMAAIFPSIGPFESIYCVMLRSENQKSIRLVWANEIDFDKKVEDETINFDIFMFTIASFLFQLNIFCERNNLKNPQKEKIEIIYKSWSNFHS